MGKGFIFGLVLAFFCGSLFGHDAESKRQEATDFSKLELKAEMPAGVTDSGRFYFVIRSNTIELEWDLPVPLPGDEPGTVKRGRSMRWATVDANAQKISLRNSAERTLGTTQWWNVDAEASLDLFTEIYDIVAFLQQKVAAAEKQLAADSARLGQVEAQRRGVQLSTFKRNLLTLSAKLREDTAQTRQYLAK